MRKTSPSTPCFPLKGLIVFLLFIPSILFGSGHKETIVLTIECPDDLTLECDGDYEAEINAWIGTADASNMCDAPITIENNLATLGDPFLSCDLSAGITVRFIASDVCSGNSDTCYANIFIDDTQSPLIECPDSLVLECDGDYEAQVNAWLASVNVFDVCDSELQVFNTFEGVLPPISCDTSNGLIVTFTVRDDCDNEEVCSSKIYLVDNDPMLEIDCPGNLFLECDGEYVDEINAWIASVVAIDDCGSGITITNNYINGSLPPLSCTMSVGLSVKFYAEDACGGKDSCVSEIIFLDDNVTPAVTCPPNLTLECGSDYQSQVDTWIATVVAVDACDSNLNLFNDFDFDSLPNPTCIANPVDSLEVIFLARDDCNNFGGCSGYIFIADRTPPVIDCGGVDSLVLQCVQGADYVSQIEAWITASSQAILDAAGTTDICDGMLSIENNYTGGVPALSCDRSIGLSVIFTVKDDCGNSATCTKKVYLDDEIPPVIDCTGISDLILECSDGMDYNATIQTWLSNTEATILANGGTMDGCDGDPTISNNYVEANFPDFNCNALGGTLVTFTIEDECGNIAQCSVFIKFTDTTNPVTSCPGNLYLECGGSDYSTQISNWLATFSATDLCDLNLTINNNYINGTLPDSTCLTNPTDSLEVIFKAEDDCENADSCKAYIFIIDSTDPVIDCSGVDSLVLECMAGADYISDIEAWITASKVTILAASTDMCDDDLEIEDDYDGTSVPDLSCELDDGLPIIFTITDNCGNFSTCTKTIYLDDTINPELSDAPDDITVECGEAVPDPAVLTATDLCDLNVEILFEADTIPSSPAVIERRWTATDECGNVDRDTQMLTIENFPPEALCKQITVILSSEPTIRPASDFDDGSFSVCSAVTILARRLDSPHCELDDSTPFADTVPFFCCDAGQMVTVELEATDAFGQKDTCSVEIPVEDESIPIVNCPPDITVECQDCDFTGVATAEGGCENAEITFYDTGLNNCHIGTFTRHWIATNGSGNADTCEQLITLINSNPFNELDIQWPVDITIENECAIPDDTGEPEYNDGPCELISHTISSETEASVAPGCTTLIREWTVFDFCQDAPPGSDCPGGIMCWTHIQIIELENTIAPEIDCTPPDDFCSTDPECISAEIPLIISVTDDCNSVLYYFQIDLFNDGTIDFDFESDDDGVITGGFDIGTHHIYWKVDDGCGNLAFCDYTFTINDCLAPVLTTFDIQSAEINPGPGIEQWATDWVVSSSTYDNCGELAEFLVRVPSLGSSQTEPPVDAFPAYTFTCDDFTNLGPFVQVDIWVRDTSFNWTYTTPVIELEDNMPPYCSVPDFAVISGIIENEEGEAVENVTVKAEGNGLANEFTTESDGLYSFDLPVENNYNISAVRNDDLLNGVSTLDLILMNKHILQISTLNSPYKMIAADINNSGYISVTDMVHLRKAILHVTTEFPDNQSWRFIDADFVFPNPDNPFESPFPEILTLNDLDEDDDTKFVAVKIGDTNCSAQSNGFSGESEDRNAEYTLTFKALDQDLKAGEACVMDFRAKDFDNIQGFQFSLFFDPDVLNFEGFNKSELLGMNRNNFGLNKISEGIITCSWNSQDTPLSIIKDSILFSLNFTAKSKGQLSDVTFMNSYYTKMEAYKNQQVIDLDLQFEKAGQSTVSHEFELYQNFPNPFTNETIISFHLPEEGTADLMIYDIAGKLVQYIPGAYKAGYNEILLDRVSLQNAGVFYYQLVYLQNTAVRKLVIKN